MSGVLRDIAPDVLKQVRTLTPYRVELDQLVNLARSRLGWYSKQVSRSIEYPWIVAQTRTRSGRFLDVGAGVSPLPLSLAKTGRRVVTLDYSPFNVDPQKLAISTEWGFLDYSVLDDAIESYNMDIAAFSTDEPFDVIYSVSVIEHMPAIVRRSAFETFARLSKQGTDVLLTTDIASGGFDLWNRDRGRVVESVSVHGGLYDLIDELAANGFELQYLEVFRRAMVTSDIAMLRAKQTSAR